MWNKLQKTMDTRRAWVFALCVLAMAIYALLMPLNSWLWESIEETYGVCVISILLAVYLYFRRLRECLEIKILALFWLWYAATRLAYGPSMVLAESKYIIERSLMIVYMAVGLVLSREDRRRILDLLTAVVGLFFFAVGLLGIVGFITRTGFINPLTGDIIGVGNAASFGKLKLLGTENTVSSAWYMLALCLMAYQFFRCENKRWRIPICLASAVYYVTLALTYGRNSKAAFSGCTAMLLVLLVLRKMWGCRAWKKAVATLCIAALAVPLTYKSFDATTALLSKAVQAAGIVTETVSAPDANGETAEPDMESLYLDPRDFGDSITNMSGRLPIFKGAFVTLSREPFRILWGSLEGEMMTVSDQVTHKDYVHFHNSYLQVLVLTGVPGFLLMLFFCLRLIWHMLRGFFSEDERLSFTTKLLTLPLTGMLAYSMLETVLFTMVDIRFALFFLLAGIFLAESYEVYPPKKRLNK